MPLRLARPAITLIVLAALVLGGCANLAPSRAQLTVTFDGATPEVLRAAALVLSERLRDAGVPVVDSQAATDGVVIRLGLDATDSDLEVARAAVDFSSSSEFRPVIAASNSTDDFEPFVDESQAPPTDSSDLAWITPAVADRFANEDCTGTPEVVTDPSGAIVACDLDGAVKYVLGPQGLDAATLVAVVAQPVVSSSGVSTGQWGVNLAFDAEGTDDFSDITGQLVGLELPRNQFAIMLDGRVLSAPAVQAAITDGRPQISGDFDQHRAEVLAARLLFAAAGLTAVSIELVEQ